VFLDLIASSFRVRDEIETSKPDPFICYLMEPSHMAKEAAARSIADLVEDGMVVGLGTGTTAARAIAHLGRRILDEGLSIAGIPTSHQSRLLAVKHRVPLTTLYEHKVVDIALDGADQVDAHLNLIKGGGGLIRAKKSLLAQRSGSVLQSMRQNCAAFESARTARSVARCMSARSERGQPNGGYCKTSTI